MPEPRTPPTGPELLRQYRAFTTTLERSYDPEFRVLWRFKQHLALKKIKDLKTLILKMKLGIVN